MIGIVENVYYRIFPAELKKKEEQIKTVERKEKSEILLEYEDLAKRKIELKEEIEKQTELLTRLIVSVKKVISVDPFAEGYNKRHVRWLFRQISLDKIYSPEELTELAHECERITFRMFVINQKLKLLDIDHRTRRRDHYRD